MDKKWLKLKQSRTPHICGIRGLRVDRQVKNPWAVLKEGSFVIFGFFSVSNAKGLTKKAFLEVTLVSLTLRVRTVF